MHCRVMPSLRVRCLHIVVLLSTLTIPVIALATPVEFSVRLLEDDGRSFSATFSVDSSELGVHPSWIEEVNDFIATVDGITYSWGPTLSAPLPFNAGAAYDPETGALIALSTPYITAAGHDSTINLRLLLDGTWTANTCIPLPRCNPDFLLGRYSIDSVIVPEPGTATLVLAGFIVWASSGSAGRAGRALGHPRGKSHAERADPVPPAVPFRQPSRGCPRTQTCSKPSAP